MKFLFYIILSIFYADLPYSGSLIMLTPAFPKNQPELFPDLLPALLSVEVLGLQGVNTQVVQFPPVRGVVPVRFLSLQTIVQQVDILRVSVQGSSHCVACSSNFRYVLVLEYLILGTWFVVNTWNWRLSTEDLVDTT